jgi:histidinol-phosphate phosphatase family protein
MKRPAVFFDRDNTLIASDGYLGDPSQVQLIPGAADAIARARALGYAVAVISNQSGVARGMFSEEDVQAVNQRMDAMLRAENAQAIVDRHEFCPFHPDGTIDVYARDSDRRKPKPGMLLSAARALELDLERSWVIGDAPRDVEAGHAAGCRAILFTDPSLARSPAADAAPATTPDFTAATLAEAIAHIEANPEPPPRPEPAVAEPPPPAAEPAAAAVVVESEPPAEPAPVAPAEPAPAPPADAAPAAPAKRVPKVAIGSKYVPPEGKEHAPVTPRDFPPRESAATDRPATEKPATAAAAIAARKLERAAARPEPTAPPAPPAPSERMESLVEQIFIELRRQHEQGSGDFSVSKLLAGITQVLVLAILLLSYFHRAEDALQTYLMLALIMQTMTIALLIMSRQR